MAKKTTAPAAKKAVQFVDDVTLTSQRDGPVDYPAIAYEGEAPKPGVEMRFTLANGVEYSGFPSDLTVSGTSILAEFRNGITPKPIN